MVMECSPWVPRNAMRRSSTSAIRIRTIARDRIKTSFGLFSNVTAWNTTRSTFGIDGPLRKTMNMAYGQRLCAIVNLGRHTLAPGYGEVGLLPK